MAEMSAKDWKAQYEAPEGQEWVCGACGNHGKNRVDIGDEACFLNAVLCYERGLNANWTTAPEASNG